MKYCAISQMVRLALFCLQVVFLFACAPAFAQDGEYYVPANLSDAIGGVEDYLYDVFSGDFSDFTDEDWEAYWEEIESVLSSQSLESLAIMRPAVDQGLVFLDAIPSWRPTTDWLRQRVDYFDLAGDVVYRNYSPRLLRRSDAWPLPRLLGDVGGTGGVTPARKTATKPAASSKPGSRVTRPERPAAGSAEVMARRSRIVRDQATWLDRLSGRAPPAGAAELIPMLKTVFKNEGLPQALVWIAEVESTMNPDAESPAGAVGLFQLMPATAQRFGLRTGILDERKTPEKNARAAAKYLNILHKRFKSWPLAMAAYNSGEGRVGSLLKQRRANTFDAIADDLSVETRMYVPKVIALVKLRENVDVLSLPGPTAGIPQLYAYRSQSPFFLFLSSAEF